MVEKVLHIIHNSKILCLIINHANPELVLQMFGGQGHFITLLEST